MSVLLAALIAAEAVIYFRAAIPRYADLIIAGVFLYLPIMFVLWRKDKFEDVALEHLNLGQSILWFALAVIIILPVFYFVAGLGAIKILKWRFNFSFPPSIFNLALSQLLLVSIPEEWLFRGYLQGRFNQVWSSNWKIFSAPGRSFPFHCGRAFRARPFRAPSSLGSPARLFPGPGLRVAPRKNRLPRRAGPVPPCRQPYIHHLPNQLRTINKRLNCYSFTNDRTIVNDLNAEICSMHPSPLLKAPSFPCAFFQ